MNNISDIIQGNSNNQRNNESLPKGVSSLGKDDFMRLLITQLEHQDPLNPLDNAEFIAQLAQFSTLEGINNMESSLETVNDQMQSINNFNALGLIGKEVKAYGNTISYNGSGTLDLDYKLSEAATDVKITIYGEDGKAIRTLEYTTQPAGENIVAWDGKDYNGNQMPAGDYKFSVSAKREDGSSIDTHEMLIGTVDGVTYKDGVAYLMVGETSVPIKDIIEIKG